MRRLGSMTSGTAPMGPSNSSPRPSPGWLCKKAHYEIASKSKVASSGPRVAEEVARQMALHDRRITVARKA
eukprot:6804736-Pyramimonas_sp.AAC.1